TGAIDVRDLVFTYPGTDRPVLDHVSLTIAAGRPVALWGATGPGKSTLIHLIPRLHDPPPGTVFLDGVDVREIPLDRLRGAIGFVPQEPFLFSDTIAGTLSPGVGGENAAQGPPSHRSDALAAGVTERLENAAAIARLDKDVASFPKGYGTLVGERGITLSGGQKQRTAIARAVMLNPRI